MIPLLPAFLLATALAQEESPGEPDIGRGPLYMSSLSPFQSMRLGLAPRTPELLPEGRLRYRNAVDWVNLWAFNEDDLLVDFEIFQGDSALAMGLGDGWLFEVGIKGAARFGGAMDPLIIDFHDTVHAEQRHRDDFEEGDFQMNLEGRDGRPSATLGKGDRGIHHSSARVTIEKVLWSGTDDDFVVSGAFTLQRDLAPNRDLKGGLPVDPVISIGAAKGLGDVFLYASVQGAWLGREEFHGIDLRPAHFAGLAAVEWRWTPDLSMIFQYLISQGAAEDWLEFSDPSHEVLLGWKIEVVPGAVFEMGLIENLVIPDNSPDFGFHVGVTVFP